ncbi:MAG: homocysteine S-methyltransferase family protein, partial [Sphingomonadales bacterium]
ALKDAIAEVDAAMGTAKPLYYMVNCAHTSHFEPVLEEGAGWMERLHGFRSNASRLSHAELDEAEELDDGDPEEFGRDYRALRTRFPSINVLGGCCGTDTRHIAAILDS